MTRNEAIRKRLPLTLVAAKRLRRDEAEGALRAAIVAAFEDRDGYTVADIADAARLTRERVYQIVKENTDV